MALAEIQALTDLAKEMGIEEGPELTAFLRDERAKAREMRQAEQEAYNRVEKQPIGLENCNKKQTTRTDKQPIGLENCDKRQPIGLGIRNTR